MFRSMIHFDLIFVKHVRFVSRFFFFFFLYVGVQLFQYHLLEKLHLLHYTAPLSKTVDSMCEPGLSILFH